MFAAMLDPRSGGPPDDRPPSAGLSVLLALSGHELLWMVNAVSVGMWRTSGQDSAYWLNEAAQLSTEVRSYLATFEIPSVGVPFAATVIVGAFPGDSLSAAGGLLGMSHSMCRESCTYNGSLDLDCYYSCMLEG